jgi:hypothetical protein
MGMIDFSGMEPRRLYVLAPDGVRLCSFEDSRDWPIIHLGPPHGLPVYLGTRVELIAHGLVPPGSRLAPGPDGTVRAWEPGQRHIGWSSAIPNGTDGHSYCACTGDYIIVILENG